MPKDLLCTVITKNYLYGARALIRSARAHQPGLEAAVFVVDPIEGYFDPKQEEFQVFTIDDLEGPKPPLDRMAFYYPPFEYCASLRPYAMATILKRTGAKRLLYLDSDIFVTRSLAPIWDALSEAPILISPHATAPVPPELDDAKDPTEVKFLKYGTYNTGMVGVRPEAEAWKMLDWWEKRTVQLRISGVTDLSPEQIWLNLVPEFFPSARSFRHGGSNIGYWRFHEGVFGKSADGYTFGPHPLLFVHFSGWDPRNPTSAGRNAPHWNSILNETWNEIATAYAKALFDAGYETTRPWPYKHARFSTGEEITREMRSYYNWLVLTGQAGEGSPFEQADFFLKEMARLNPTLVKRAFGKIKRALFT